MEKGMYGYLEHRKKVQLRWASLFAVIVSVLVLAGLAIWGTRMNWLMIPAMICVLPFANFLVTYLALASYHSPEEEKYEELAYFEEAGMLLSDLVLVDEKGARAPLDFAVIYPNGVAGYQSVKKDTRDKITVTVNETLKRRGIPMRIIVYRDWDAFLARISEMSIPANEEETDRVERAREAVISLSL